MYIIYGVDPFFMGDVMAKEKKKKITIDNKMENTQRKIQKEIKKCKKKLAKLLALHEDGKECWALNRKGKKTKRKIVKTQGIIKDSKRYERLLAHIEKLELQV